MDHDHACQHTRGDAGTVCVCTCGKPDDASRTGSAGIFPEYRRDDRGNAGWHGREQHGKKYRNYIGSIFIFIFVSNISGLFGLRPPTADYGVTLPLGIITFCIIQYNNVKYNKFGAFTDLFKPIPILFPINLIGEIAVPFSLSLRLFGNVLSGTVMMSLIYSLLSKIAVGWPGFLHIYFDLFSGAIQTYVFCMLTMVFTSQKMPQEN